MPNLENSRIFKTDYAGRELTVEIGKYAEQANGACLVRCGDTVVNVTVCMAEQPREGMDFFPLSVDYEEKMFAVGKIPGGFKKREGRASDKAILVSRLIDRVNRARAGVDNYIEAVQLVLVYHILSPLYQKKRRTAQTLRLLKLCFRAESDPIQKLLAFL